MKSLRIFSKLWVKDVLPPGSVTDFAGVTAPEGWLLCYGQEVSRADYAALFLAIGTTYGVGDGSTTFNLPDCRGRVKAGKDNMGGVAAGRLTSALSGVDGAALGSTGGAQVHSLQEAQLASHTHVQNSHFHGVPGRASSGTTASSGRFAVPATGGAVDNIDTFGGFGTNQNTGLGSAHQNTQPTIIFNTIIKV